MNTIPIPIRNTIAKTVVCVASVAAFGVAWSLASHDRILLILSILAATFGVLKIIHMIGGARKGNYHLLECTVLSISRSKLFDRHSVRVCLGDGTEQTLTLGGRTQLREGESYRLYLAGRAEDELLVSVPEYFRSAKTLMGFERLQDK